MSDQFESPENRRSTERVPIEAEVELQFDTVAEFVREYSENLSLGGMFVKTGEPKPQGTPVRFVLHLGDYDLRGSGEVAWIRRVAGGPEEPAGMGICFQDLAPEDREIIFTVVDNYIQAGGTPFDLEAEAP
ncbi:MAG: TIGR02266 family protein [Thermoanaerobaculia bacterium]|nr:TIGR02266 family protein [Thermoanaerobaculia bacterium]